MEIEVKLKYLSLIIPILVNSCPVKAALSPDRCKVIQPFKECKKPIKATLQSCNYLANRNRPPFIFNANSPPICLGPREILKPLAQKGKCQIFHLPGSLKECQNRLLMECLKKKFFPAPLWPVAPEKFGEFTVPPFRNTPDSNAEVCFWYNAGEKSWPIAQRVMNN